MAIFLGLFENMDDVCEEFSIDKSVLYRDDVYMLLAAYADEDYCGEAFVLFMTEDGKIYEVNGSHCSCYGLEDQWEPEETSVESLTHRMKEGNLWAHWVEKDKFDHAMERILNMMPVLQAEG